MPLTLYRYILKDILRMLLLSTAVLVTVISFAAAIKPLSDGLLDFGGLLKFVSVTAPTMLVYALPFSTAFAVTLGFARLVADNEITACCASGISYRIIVLPVVALGSVLMVFLFVMSNWVLPPFNQIALSLIQKDAMRVLVHQLKKGEAVVFGEYKIFAEEAEEVPPPVLENSALQPDQLVLLRGVAVGRLDPLTQETLSDHTAEQADILVFRDAGRTWVQFRLKNPLYYDEGAQGDTAGSLAVGANQAEMLPNLELPNRFKDKPSTMTWGELSQISRNPESHPRTMAERDKLIGAMLDAQLLNRVAQGLAQSAEIYVAPQPGAIEGELRGMRLNGAREEEYFIISSPVVTAKDTFLTVAGTAQRPLRIDHYEQGRLSRRYEARGEVRMVTAAAAQMGGEPRISMIMRDVVMMDPRRSDRNTERSELRLNRLWWPQNFRATYDEPSAKELLALAKSDFAEVPAVQKTAKTLALQLGRLVNRVSAEFHERAATALGCLLAALMGAMLSIHLRGRVPLVVYFWVFLTVLGMTITLQTGTRLAGDPSRGMAFGLIVLWAGVLGLAGAIGIIYARVSRN